MKSKTSLREGSVYVGAVSALAVVAAIGVIVTFAWSHVGGMPPNPHHFTVVKSDAEWKRILPADTYDVTRRAGTEPAFSGKYDHLFAPGTYICADCALPLYSSKTKFDSGTGWPSFYKPITPGSVIQQADNSLGDSRTEILCSRCGAHLGHVFDDGPKPTGLRYCMNSVALKFIPAVEMVPKPKATRKTTQSKPKG